MRYRARLTAVALLVTLCLTAGPARAGDDDAAAGKALRFDALDSRLQREVVNAARAYLDPEVEFMWRVHKQLLESFAKIEEAENATVLADIPFLRQVVYQGRHFLPRFSDSRWRKEASVTRFKKTGAVYNSLKSERWRFTYALPKDYPRARALTKVPRPQPAPLLLSLMERQDGVDSSNEAEAYPGVAVLERRYPKDAAQALYDHWFLLAPVTARARFLDTDGSLRHRFLTAVLTEFWRRYHVDFDRIVVDGAAREASALAAAFPHVFAGLVLRGGEVEREVVRNYAAVPVFVVGDDALAAVLEEAGHPDVTRGNDAELLAWLEQRKRVVPASFEWTALRADHRYPNWIHITHPEPNASTRHTLSVRTDRETNTIDIRAEGVEKIQIFLNDEIVDLDKEVQLVLNGEARSVQVTRDLKQVFQKDPDIRKNMNFGWLYPVVINDVLIRGSPGPARLEEDAPPELEDPLVLEVQQAFLLGRPDHVRQLLDGVENPEDVLPLALLDLWWRVTDDPDKRAFYAEVARRAEGLVGEQLRWLLGGGDTPYPHPTDPHRDPWPVLTALVLDRQVREHTGRLHMPDVSPLATLEPPHAWSEWWEGWQGYVLGELMQDAYQGVPPERRNSEEQRALDEQADGQRRTNLILAAVFGLLFVGGVLAAGRRLRR